MVCTQKGSMEQDKMPVFISHLDRFVRKTVLSTSDYSFCLDGHSSSEVALCVCQKKFQAVQSPANTTQELQPCDQDINSTFNTSVRRKRDILCSLESNEISSVRVKLMCALRALQAVTVKDVQVDFSKTGLWPMNFDFDSRFWTTADSHRDHLNDVKEQKEGTISFPMRALKLIDDETNMSEIKDVMRHKIGPSRKLQAVQFILKVCKYRMIFFMSVGSNSGGKQSSVGGTGNSEKGISSNELYCDENEDRAKTAF